LKLVKQIVESKLYPDNAVACCHGNLNGDIIVKYWWTSKSWNETKCRKL